MAYIGTSPSNGVRRVHTYTATASQTTFTGAGAEGTSLSYKDSNFVDVYQNGIKLGDADYTSTSGTSIVLAQGASVDDLVVVVVFDVFSVADTVSKADGGTFDSGVTVSGDLTVDTDTLKVDSSNNRVGIGTSAPDKLLHLNATGGDSIIRMTRSNSASTDDNLGSIEFENSAGTVLAGIKGTSMSGNTEAGLIFGAGGGNAERMRINNGGAVLINSTARNDLGVVEILTTIGTDNAMIIKTAESGASGSATAMKFRFNSSTTGSIGYSSSGTSFNTSSDYRLKENVEYSFDATTELKKLKPCKFNFKTDKDRIVEGFLAHEVQDIVPQAITGKKDEVDEDDNPVYQGIDQSKLVPLLVKSLQEALAEIDTLKTKVAALENAE